MLVFQGVDVDFVEATSASSKSPEPTSCRIFILFGMFQNDSLLGKFHFLVLGPGSTFECSTYGSNMLN